ncbi:MULTISPECIES: translation elongation factor Ts [Pseudoalteromonas]|jgi:elongation factor Ts|uniref:Elongation factor Ts n=3 Tax=Pseudoalteromonas TaxID=53246 RepID=EFTS_PSET1|nr:MULTISPECIES: translation elongation factor Ts [Pseudoalteromonas]P61330.2 RecName: Full=Elongation factor Ts; Short=EF-Ts [Pseudoalteromonas translucida TAC125]ALS33583.1 elongation factor Ts [Pseudoalteromonas translucida KMM 520]ASM54684.1 elongation factor Ts [Pseudoalteromonas nigrifaciens]MBB1370594.1 elongation factor Ts [Pseudoalteromonas sp. SR45-4]MBB1406509.1 elongation factor Ts [Pseudoalteromonas sp. SG44-5]MBE0418950.1 elongation factor Ts [Pseudoalteromonas nigrifaciens]|tara:strand:- start:24843 stop:25694 length:852 start_codon:yes stop_codon:yes gene_type:complete
MAVTTALVKELRERTGAGMMDCKKALTETDGDIELAIENMRKSGAAKAAKKAGNIAAEGAIIIKKNGNVAVLVEVNCQTDFVAKDVSFLAFADKVAEAAIADTVTIEDLQAKFEEARVELVTKIGENINVRRLQYITGENLVEYRHGDRIGVVVAGVADEETLKHVAMHVAASSPEYLTPSDVPADVVAKEQQVQIEIAMNEGKSAEIAEKMVVGRMKKFTGEVSLTGQAFIMEPKKTVGEILKEKNATVTSFVRVEVGEGIERKEEDFAAEVAAQIAAAKAK